MEWFANLWNWFREDEDGEVVNVVPDKDKALLDLHNSKRGALFPLVVNDKLSTAARKHAEWMAKNNTMSHNQGRRTVADRAKAEGYGWNYVGENIAMGYTDVNSVFEGWMNSAGHRANIMNRNYKDIGFGVATTSKGTLYWCVVFGSQS
jgi:uncharacterized protein YkwD